MSDEWRNTSKRSVRWHVGTTWTCCSNPLCSSSVMLWLLLVYKVEMKIKGNYSETVDSVQEAVTDATNSPTEADFRSCYEGSKTRWHECIVRERCYFEGVLYRSPWLIVYTTFKIFSIITFSIRLVYNSYVSSRFVNASLRIQYYMTIYRSCICRYVKFDVLVCKIYSRKFDNEWCYMQLSTCLVLNFQIKM